MRAGDVLLEHRVALAREVLVQDGQLLRERMDKARVSDDDILEQARQTRAIERLEQIKYAVLERGGNISIIPYPGAGDRPFAPETQPASGSRQD